MKWTLVCFLFATVARSSVDVQAPAGTSAGLAGPGITVIERVSWL